VKPNGDSAGGCGPTVIRLRKIHGPTESVPPFVISFVIAKVQGIP
jgi:hypothetical protein